MMWCRVDIFTCCVVTSTVISLTDDTDVLALTIVLCTHYGCAEIILPILTIVLVAYVSVAVATSVAVALFAMT
jgi:hypothetical protein